MMVVTARDWTSSPEAIKRAHPDISHEVLKGYLTAALRQLHGKDAYRMVEGIEAGGGDGAGACATTLTEVKREIDDPSEAVQEVEGLEVTSPPVGPSTSVHTLGVAAVAPEAPSSAPAAYATPKPKSAAFVGGTGIGVRTPATGGQIGPKAAAPALPSVAPPPGLEGDTSNQDFVAPPSKKRGKQKTMQDRYRELAALAELCDDSTETGSDSTAPVNVEEAGVLECTNPRRVFRNPNGELYTDAGARNHPLFVREAADAIEGDKGSEDPGWDPNFGDTPSIRERQKQHGLVQNIWEPRDDTEWLQIYNASLGPFADETRPTPYPMGAQYSMQRRLWDNAAHGVTKLTRHDATKVGLTMDQGGWMSIKQLCYWARHGRIEKYTDSGAQLSLAVTPWPCFRAMPPTPSWFVGLALSDQKGRFQIAVKMRQRANEARSQVIEAIGIRATQGHSVKLGIDGSRLFSPLTTGVVPSISALCHVTREEHLPSIFRSGLVPGGGEGGREFTHLGWTLEDDKRNVVTGRGRRDYNATIILKPQVINRFPIVLSHNGVLLTDSVIPFEYFQKVLVKRGQTKICFYDCEFCDKNVTGYIPSDGLGLGSERNAGDRSGQPPADAQGDAQLFFGWERAIINCPNPDCLAPMPAGCLMCLTCESPIVFGEASRISDQSFVTPQQAAAAELGLVSDHARRERELKRLARIATYGSMLNARSLRGALRREFKQQLKYRVRWPAKIADKPGMSRDGCFQLIPGQDRVPPWDGTKLPVPTLDDCHNHMAAMT